MAAPNKGLHDQLDCKVFNFGKSIGLKKIISWARMKFTSVNSRSLIIKTKKKAMYKFQFTLAGTMIPIIQEKSLKHQEKTFDQGHFSSFENLDIWLVGFYGISTFVGYSTPNLFLCK